MQFMVTFPLTHRDYNARIARFLETGAPPPEGVTLHGRWFAVGHHKGFMLVETDDPKALFRWVSEWSDLIDFEVDAVLRDDEAAAVLQAMM